MLYIAPGHDDIAAVEVAAAPFYGAGYDGRPVAAFKSNTRTSLGHIRAQGK